MLKYHYKQYIFFIILIFSSPVHSQQSFYLLADKIIKNDKKKVIVATGNVEMQSGKIKTSSDTLQFNTEKNQIILKGNIKILNEQGDIVFAEKAILDNKLKEGVIRKLGILMSDESRLVASSAQKDSKKYKTVYKNISYSDAQLQEAIARLYIYFADNKIEKLIKEMDESNDLSILEDLEDLKKKIEFYQNTL